MSKEGKVLMPRVKMGEKPEDCWQWLGARNKRTGYGKKQYCGRTELAHRWIYQQLFGPIPDGMVINHLCGNRICANPRHLETVSQAENIRKGRATILTLDKVRQIREALATLKWGERQALADRFGVSPQIISNIKHGRIWTAP